ncbi:MAG: hypothetical protein J5J06_16725 [Phycisphaerae bacterium]|nr:hypothetical protein [Phycisphaerae bacterium]
MHRPLTVCILLSFFGTTGVAFAQMNEPPEFPPSPPGAVVQHSGDGCLLIASGDIVPGDADWLELNLPFDSEFTVVDVDIEGLVGESLLSVHLSDGRVLFSTRDNNNSTDGTCGTGPASNPLGNRRDSAISLGATSRNLMIEIGVTGYPDFALSGAHTQAFHYDVWVYALGQGGCIDDFECDDGVDCTVDICNVDSGECEYWPDNDFCNNGLFCDGVERCDMNEGCVAGIVFDCDDRVDCTEDFCDERTQSCSHWPRHDFCDDGVFCNGGELCHPRRGCQAGQPPCPDFCDETYGCSRGRFPAPPYWNGGSSNGRKR